MLRAVMPESDLAPGPCVPLPPPSPRPSASDVIKARDALRAAKAPLVIVGKGAAYARAEKEVRIYRFRNSHSVPRSIDRVLDCIACTNNPNVTCRSVLPESYIQIRQLISSTGLPFLPTPMGKGVLPDTDPGSVAPARTMALQKADVVVLLGARMNWMLHFGKSPRLWALHCNDVFLQDSTDIVSSKVPS